MHYYQFNIGDYTSHTQHLEPMEDLAYRRMLDWLYLNEMPLPDDVADIARLIRMRSHTDCIAVVLREFFERSADGYTHNRVSRELEKFHAKSEKAKKSAEARWKKRSSNHAGSADANALRPECEGNANQEPITNNHKPIQEGEESPRLPHCPHQKILDMYHSTLKAMPQVRVMTDARKRQLASLWKQHPDIDWWGRYFGYCATSDFLCGRSDGKPGQPPFVADLEWITKPSNHAKIIEGKYHQKAAT